MTSDTSKAFSARYGVQLDNGVALLTGSDVPWTSLSGQTITEGSLYIRSNGELYQNLAGANASSSDWSLIIDADGVVQASGGDADTLDGLDSTQFLRSDVADTANASITFVDNAEVILGTDADFRMDWNGTQTVFRSFTHGAPLNIQGEDAGGTNRNMIYTDPDGGVSLYFTGNLHFQTNSAGTVTYGDVLVNGGDVVLNTFAEGIDFGGAGRVRYEATADAIRFEDTGAGSAVVMYVLMDGTKNVKVFGDFTVGGGDITLEGTGRIQGIDTVSAATDAANKSYVDALSGTVDAGTLDGLDSTQFLRSDANDTATGNITFSGAVYLPSGGTQSGPFVSFSGDANTGFYSNVADTISATVGGLRKFFIDANGVEIDDDLEVDGNLYVGDQDVRYLSDVTGNYGSIQVNGSGVASWEGFNIDGRAVFMHNGDTTTGIYNDVHNHWLVRCIHEGAIFLYHNNSIQFQTVNGGFYFGNNLTAATQGLLYHNNDTNGLLIRNQSENAAWNHVTIQGENTSGTVRTCAVFHPDGAAELYHDNTRTVQTSSLGLEFGAAVSGLDKGAIEYSGTTVTLKNYTHGGIVQLNAENSVGTNRSLFYADPDGAVSLYYDGSYTVQTAADGLYFGSGLTSANKGAALHTGSNLDIISYDHGAGLRLIGEDIGGTQRVILGSDPDGACDLYYAGNPKISTSNAGATVTGDLTTTGDITVSGGDLTLSGTGRIQGIDTVTASTDAANKQYVDDSVGSGTGGGSDSVFHLNDQNVTTDYTLSGTKNAMTAGPIEIDNGVTVTISAGATWTVV